MALIANIDTLHAAVLIDNYAAQCKELLEALQSKLEQRFMTRNFSVEFMLLGGVNFRIIGGRYNRSYGLECENFNLYFNHIDNNANYPLYVEFRQSYMWQEGYQQAWAKFLDWIKSMGWKYVTSKVARADLACHTDAPILQKEYLNFLYHDPRAEKEDLPEIANDPFLFRAYEKAGQYTGFRVGNGNPLMLRVYNKSLEIKISNKLWFETVWQQHGLKEPVINIEFEIKRNWFYEYQIDTVEELFESLGDIWLKLTRNYISFRYQDNARARRRTIMPFWDEIRRSSFEYNGCILSRRKEKEANIEKIKQGALGYISSFAAALGYEDINLDVMQELLAGVQQMAAAKDINIKERIERKKYRRINEVDDDNLFFDKDLSWREKQRLRAFTRKL